MAHNGNQKSRFLRWYHGLTGGNWGTNPGDYDPVFVRDSVRRVGYLYGPKRYFRLRTDGWEHLPASPALIVSNHSGGAAAPDAWGFLMEWHRRFDAVRPIHTMAHEMVLSIWATGYPFSRLGVLRADPQLAYEVLTRWQRDIFVMPGGDVDVFRPYKDRYKTQFAGRKGYARLALRAGVPVVPVANAGAHETLLVLTDGQKVANTLRLNQLFRLNVFPIHLSLPWGLAIGPLPHLPLPVLLRYKIGRPIWPSVRLAPGEEPSPEMVDAYDRQVQAGLQQLLQQLQAEDVPLQQRLKAVGRRWWFQAQQKLLEASNLGLNDLQPGYAGIP